MNDLAFGASIPETVFIDREFCGPTSFGSRKISLGCAVIRVPFFRHA
jgi:hypothetical protein